MAFIAVLFLQTYRRPPRSFPLLSGHFCQYKKLSLKTRVNVSFCFSFCFSSSCSYCFYIWRYKNIKWRILRFKDVTLCNNYAAQPNNKHSFIYLKRFIYLFQNQKPPWNAKLLATSGVMVSAAWHLDNGYPVHISHIQVFSSMYLFISTYIYLYLCPTEI